MKSERLDKIQYRKNQSIKDVLKGFEQTAVYTEHGGFGVIIDQDGKCCGVVTDGDIRRKVLNGISINMPIAEAMNSKFVFTKPGDSPHEILRLFDHRINNIPVIDERGELVDLLQISNFNASARVEHKIIRSRVPVRISFSGGGTDMSYFINQNQSAVLSSTINKYCYASILVRPDNKIRIVSKDLNQKCEVESLDKLKYGNSLDLIKASVKIMQPDFGFDLEVLSEFECGTGLGGSSAVSVAIIGAFNYFRNENHLDKYHIADLAYQAERIELNNTGGWQDQYSTSFGGINWIEFRENEIMVHPLRVSRDVMLELHYNLLLFRFGKNRVSGDISCDQKQRFQDKKAVMREKYMQMYRLTKEMKEALLRGKLKRFGDLLDECWNLKKSFSDKVSNALVEKLYNAARMEGALGGKVLGAGGGGYLLLYVSPLYQKAVCGTLEELGARHEPFDFTDEGLETWATQR
jgi:D-glycero-alpha-D-manno-heptose-7-phosphate kinase